MSTAATTGFAWVRPRLRVAGRSWSSFQVCGATGLLLGTALAMSLAGPAGLSRAALAGLLAVAGVVFVTLAMATKVLTGRESLVYYHHEVAVLAACALVLRAFGLPVLPYLDLTALGLGVFLACGRQGCLMVGCCHGRPHAWGVRYGEAHAAEGFTPAYVGVRLFPVQALESLLVVAIVGGAAVLVLRREPPGSALSWYVASYSALRIWLEELRGDPGRACWRGLSEAQWTSALILAGVVAGEWRGRLPRSAWHVVLLAVACLSLTFLAARRATVRALLQPRHAAEVAAIVGAIPSRVHHVRVHRTSLAVCLSTQALWGTDGAAALLVSLSRADPRLTALEARALGGLVARITSTRGDAALRGGRRGVFHLIVRDPRGRDD